VIFGGAPSGILPRKNSLPAGSRDTSTGSFSVVDTSNTLLPLAAGRAAFGGVAVLGAVPLCRVAEITTEPGA
jgi:hypothetical protein